jgi:putative addiction module component (TIGR02574 family)
MTFEELQAEALKLSSPLRAQLAELLLSSLDKDPAVDEAWEVEAERRYQAYLAGETQAAPAEEAFDRIRRGLRR